MSNILYCKSNLIESLGYDDIGNMVMVMKKTGQWTTLRLHSDSSIYDGETKTIKHNGVLYHNAFPIEVMLAS